MNSTIALLATTLATFITIYTYLIIRVLLTWFHNISWYNQPFNFEPVDRISQLFIPPLGGIDISPILAILLLQLVGGLVGGLSSPGLFKLKLPAYLGAGTIPGFK